jgi:hypothetical protein
MRRGLLVALAMAATACSSAAGPAIGPPADTARVGLIEWDITASAEALTEGTVTLEVTNAGTTAHDLRISGGGQEKATPMLPAGDTATVTIQVDAGDEMVLWCSVPGHREQGMERRLRAVNGSSA